MRPGLADPHVPACTGRWSTASQRWGWQDPARFYYVHLGEKPDPHSSQVFIVNDAPRTAITMTVEMTVAAIGRNAGYDIVAVVQFLAELLKS